MSDSDKYTLSLQSNGRVRIQENETRLFAFYDNCGAFKGGNLPQSPEISEVIRDYLVNNVWN